MVSVVWAHLKARIIRAVLILKEVGREIQNQQISSLGGYLQVNPAGRPQIEGIFNQRHFDHPSHPF